MTVQADAVQIKFDNSVAFSSEINISIHFYKNDLLSAYFTVMVLSIEQILHVTLFSSLNGLLGPALVHC